MLRLNYFRILFSGMMIYAMSCLCKYLGVPGCDGATLVRQPEEGRYPRVKISGISSKFLYFSLTMHFFIGNSICLPLTKYLVSNLIFCKIKWIFHKSYLKFTEQIHSL